MVTRALLVVAALAGSAAAERPPVPPGPSSPPAPPPSPSAPAYTRLGTRVSVATVPLERATMASYAAGVSFDRPISGDLRLVGEYDYVWLGSLDGAEVGVAGLPASGHRLQAAARFPLLRGLASRSGLFEAYLDGDVGGGASIIDDPMRGVIAPVHAFAGIHAGITLFSPDRHALWEYDVLVRVVGSPDGVGAVLGVGMSWGD